MKIGIPRALLYYWYGHIWQNFWQKSGVETVTSPPTDRQILAAGSAVAIDELCLPVKIFLGHIRALETDVDLVMVPHLVKVEPGAYVCPKFMGLPDLVIHTLPRLKEKLLLVKVGPKQTDMIGSLSKAAARIGMVPASRKAMEAFFIQGEPPALLTVKSYQPLAAVHFQSQLTIGLLGHPYCLYDPCFNLNLLQILKNNGIRFLTPEMMPDGYRSLGSSRLNKRLFWTIGRSQFDALEWMLRHVQEKVAGFIHLDSFACGPEAIVGDMLERRVKEAGRPFLRLNFEEHSGEAGVITRVEAFLSMLKYREPVADCKLPVSG